LDPPRTETWEHGRDGIRVFGRGAVPVPAPAGWRRELSVPAVLACAEGSAVRWSDTGCHRRRWNGMRKSPAASTRPLRRRAAATADTSILLPGFRLRFGTIGQSNHFVELQVVDEVFDPEAAEVLGVSPGQLRLQVTAAAGSDRSCGTAGRPGARRCPGRRAHDAVAAAPRTCHGPVVPQLRQRIALYFADGCHAIPVDGRGERVSGERGSD